MVIDNLQKMDNSYKFQNKAILEKFSEENGVLIFNDKPIRPINTITLQKEEW